MAGVKIRGLDNLKEVLRSFPARLQERATNTGVRKAAGKLVIAFRRAAYAAPLAKGYKRTNKLRKSLRGQVGKRPGNKGKAWVGLKKFAGQSKVLNYYRTLEQGRKGRSGRRGSPPMRPFFERAWQANRAAIGELLVRETEKALLYEAGKAYGRSQGRR